MKDLYLSLIPYYDQAEKRGGYKLGVILPQDSDRIEIIGPTNRNVWLQSSMLHNLLFGRDLLDYLEDLHGPGKQPESRRVISYDCSISASIIIAPMLNRGYKQTDQWTPKKGEFFILEDSHQIHTLVFRSRKTGCEIRFISIKAFVRGQGLPGIWDQIREDYEDPIGDQPIEDWGEPSSGGLSAAYHHCKVLREIWRHQFDSGFIFETSGRQISAGGIAWQNFTRQCVAATRLKPRAFLWPSMQPEEILEARNVMEDLLRHGNRGGICYATPGEYEDVHGYDLNWAYGAALCDYIPIGPLLNYPPDEGIFTGIVWPQGYFQLKQGRIPIISWADEGQCARYAWDQIYAPHQKVQQFFLDGSMPFYQDEWELLLQFYEPVGQYEITHFCYVEIIRWGILEERVNLLHRLAMEYPRDKIFNKMQIVSLYGKMCQHEEAENIWYDYRPDDQGVYHIIRISRTVPIQSQHLALGMWITAYCRIRIMEQILSLIDAGVSPDDVVYIDTDQIYLVGNHDDKFTISSDVGKWKREFTGDMRVLGQKAYQVRSGEKLETKCSSLPNEIKRTLGWGQLDQGEEYPYYVYQRDPQTFARVPMPHNYAVHFGVFEDPTDPAWVVPEEVEHANRQYTD